MHTYYINKMQRNNYLKDRLKNLTQKGINNLNRPLSIKEI